MRRLMNSKIKPETYMQIRKSENFESKKFSYVEIFKTLKKLGYVDDEESAQNPDDHYEQGIDLLIRDNFELTVLFLRMAILLNPQHHKAIYQLSGLIGNAKIKAEASDFDILANQEMYKETPHEQEDALLRYIINIKNKSEFTQHAKHSLLELINKKLIKPQVGDLETHHSQSQQREFKNETKATSDSNKHSSTKNIPLEKLVLHSSFEFTAAQPIPTPDFCKRLEEEVDQTINTTHSASPTNK